MSDLLPEIIEDEASENEKGDYFINGIYETTFKLKLKSGRLCHTEESAGVFPPARLDFSMQDDQKVLGIRQKSTQAFWTKDDVRSPIEPLENQEPRCEYVNIRVDDQIVEIKFMFDVPEEAVSHFEFTFQSGIKLYFQALSNSCVNICHARDIKLKIED